MFFDGYIYIFIGFIFYKFGWMMYFVILMYWIGMLIFFILGLLFCLFDWFDKRFFQFFVLKMDGQYFGKVLNSNKSF